MYSQSMQPDEPLNLIFGGLQTGPTFSIYHLRNETEDLSCFGMTFGLQFGKDQVPVHADLEPASVRGNERHRFDHMLVILQQVLRQAHGPVGVMSNCAVDDFDLQH